MTRALGYVRAWRAGEGLADEVAAVERYGVDAVFTDVSSDSSTQPGLADCLLSLKEGDALVVPSAARLSPSIAHFVHLVAGLDARGVAFRSLLEPALSTNDSRASTAETLAALDSARRQLVGLRTREGMRRAQAEGRRPGRPSVMTPERLAVAEELRRQHRSLAHIAGVIGVSPSAVQRALSVPA